MIWYALAFRAFAVSGLGALSGAALGFGVFGATFEALYALTLGALLASALGWVLLAGPRGRGVKRVLASPSDGTAEPPAR